MSSDYVSRFQNRSILRENKNLSFDIIKHFKSLVDMVVTSESSENDYHTDDNGRSKIKFEHCTNQHCKICHVNGLEIVFLPCRHVVACTSCSVHLTKCPICRSDLKCLLKIFMPYKICHVNGLEIVFYPVDMLLHVQAVLYILQNVLYAEVI